MPFWLWTLFQDYYFLEWLWQLLDTCLPGGLPCASFYWPFLLVFLAPVITAFMSTTWTWLLVLPARSWASPDSLRASSALSRQSSPHWSSYTQWVYYTYSNNNFVYKGFILILRMQESSNFEWSLHPYWLSAVTRPGCCGNFGHS